MHTTYLRLFLVYTFSTVGFQNTQPAKDFQSLPHPASRTIGYFPLNETNATYSLAKSLPRLISRAGSFIGMSTEAKTTLFEIAELSPVEREAALVEALESFSEAERAQLTQELVNTAEEAAVESAEMAEAGQVTEEVSEVAGNTGVVEEAAESGGIAETIPKKGEIEKVPLTFAEQLAEELGATLKDARTGRGHALTLKYGRKREIVIRLMDAGSGGREHPYFRIAIDGKGAYTEAGSLSNNLEITHHDIKNISNAREKIKEILKKIKKSKK